MRARTVDVLLMVGLFLVGAAILWTLFTLGNDRSRPARVADDPPAASAPADDTTGDVRAVPPGEAPTATEPGDDGAPGTSAAPDSDLVSDQSEGVGPDEPSTAIEPPVEIISGDPVPLERVGFSYTTGGAGACGITLEAWEHVAVSRDLLAIYGCGTEVTIDLEEPVAGRSEVTLLVADTMNPQFTRTANIYVAPDEPANQYGITGGTFRP